MYAQIALPIPVQTLFIYEIPPNLEGKIGLGHAVLVPLEKRLLSGFVVKLIPEAKIEGVKRIIGLLDPEPLFSEKMLRLTEYMSRYYCCFWGESLKAALPTELQAETCLGVKKKEFDQKEVEGLTQRQMEILNLLNKNPQLKIASIRRKLGHQEIYSDLCDLERKQILEFYSEPGMPGAGLRYEKFVRIKEFPLQEDQLEVLKTKAPRQWECVQALLKNQGELSLNELKKVFRSPTPVVKQLEKKGFAEILLKEKTEDAGQPVGASAQSEEELGSEELRALLQIRKAIEEKKHQVFLLYDSDRSRRIRIYTEAIKEVLKNQRQACILVPEIFLITQLTSDLKSCFGDNIAPFHSRLSSSRRFHTWKKVKAGELPVVVGTRSAIFSPLNHLGLIIVDEEHDSSYKQEDSDPRYHARDIAVKRAEMEKGVVILGSATPSLESFHNAWKGKYVLCRLEEKTKKKTLTRVEIVDMHQERKESNFSPFSRRLSHLMEDRLSKKEKIVLFLNRRGFSRVVKCQDCGHVYLCPNCNISLTFHQTDYSLRCHFCNFRTRAGTTCPKCGGHSFSYAGMGTERIDQEIINRFPSASVLRMDLDTASGGRSHQRIIDSLKNKDFDLLLGTRMITKEWGFPDVSLVGIISADFSLDFPDFRAKERTFQVLNQVISIAKENGEVVIQTYHPQDWSIKLATQGDFQRFFELEIAEREELSYPPFSHLILIRFSGKNKKQVSELSRRFALRLKRKLESKKEVDILGPAPAPLSKIRGRHRDQILIKTKKVDETVESVRSTSQMKSLKKGSSVRITINVDPVEMM
jgi:primosomal protein N' (replication factor Y)